MSDSSLVLILADASYSGQSHVQGAEPSWLLLLPLSCHHELTLDNCVHSGLRDYFQQGSESSESTKTTMNDIAKIVTTLVRRSCPDLYCVCAQWAERLLMEGQTEQWGDKWEERFKDGSGTKKVCFVAGSLSCHTFCTICSCP